MTVKSGLGWFLLCLLAGAVLPGCSLLFVAQGKTGISSTPAGAVPRAASLEKRLGGPVVLKHKVEKGDDLPFLASAFYEKKGVEKIRSANPKTGNGYLRVGTFLRIVNPDYFPSPGELRDKKKQLRKASASPSRTVGPQDPRAFSSPDNGEEEKTSALSRGPGLTTLSPPGRS